MTDAMEPAPDEELAALHRDVQVAEGEKLLAALRFAHKLLPEPGPVFTVRERAGMLLLPHRRGAYSERARTFAKALHYGTHEGDAASQVLAALEASGAEWDEDGGRWYLP